MPNLLFHLNRFDTTTSQREREQRLIFLKENDNKPSELRLEEAKKTAGKKYYEISDDPNIVLEDKIAAKEKYETAYNRWLEAHTEQVRKRLEELNTAPCCSLHR